MLTPPRRGRAGNAKVSFTRTQAKALLRAEDARITLGLSTGLRSGEAMALRWEDIDFDRAVAELSWSITEAPFQHGCGRSCGKTRAGNCPRRILEISDSLEAISLVGRLVLVRPQSDPPRQIPLTPTAVAQLRQLRDSEDGPNPYGLVWHRPNGAPQTISDDNHHLRSVLRRAEIDQSASTIHWLRHTYVTLSEHAGIPWAAAASVSGNGSSEASDPYCHVLTGEGRKAVTTLECWVEGNARQPVSAYPQRKREDARSRVARFASSRSM